MDESFEKRPFGAPGLGEFVASQPREAEVSERVLSGKDVLYVLTYIYDGGIIREHIRDLTLERKL